MVSLTTATFLALSMFDHVVVGGAADLLVGRRVAEAIGYFFASVSESTQQGCIWGTFVARDQRQTASASPEFSGPQMTLHLVRRVSSAAPFTALVGSLCVSRMISSICRPLMPPAALISFTASSVPRLMPMPVDDGTGQRRQIADPDRLFCRDGGLGDAACKDGGAGRFSA